MKEQTVILFFIFKAHFFIKAVQSALRDKIEQNYTAQTHYVPVAPKEE